MVIIFSNVIHNLFVLAHTFALISLLCLLVVFFFCYIPLLYLPDPSFFLETTLTCACLPLIYRCTVRCPANNVHMQQG